jgi:ATP-binding cassette subfamily F protein 3
MLQIRNLEKSFGTQPLFEGVSLQMESGERLGLIGRNGHGKSTLFRMILGEEHQDAGDIVMPRGYRVGHLEQHLKFTEPTLLDEGCLGLPEGEEHCRYKVEAILFGLGFSKDDMERSPHEFSGGYQIRLNLAKVLVSEPNLLLLDEPTNYLDIVSMRWLVSFLRAWQNEMIIISHDREFMDSVTTHTAAIHRCKLRKIRGGTAKLYEQILLEEEIHEKTRANDEKKRAQLQVFIDRFRAKASKAKAVQSKIKLLDKRERLKKLDEVDALDFSFGAAPFEAKNVLTAMNVSFSYPNGPELIRNFDLSVGSGDRIAIVGKNGKGKSTLLSLIAGELEPLSGTVKPHAEANIGYFGQTNVQRLHPHLSVEGEIYDANPKLDRTRVRGLCGLMMFDGDKAEKKIQNLSGGEKSRVLLGRILATPTNLLLLDEPTNHLDMESIEALVEAIQEFPGAVIIVTHSEMILRAVAEKLVVFQDGGHEVFPGTYDEFIERIGWHDDEGGVASNGKKTANRKDDRRQRAELIAERSRVLNPLKKQIETLENEITILEKRLADSNAALISATERTEGSTIAKAAHEIGLTQKKIDALFERLAEVTSEHDEKVVKFENEN